MREVGARAAGRARSGCNGGATCSPAAAAARSRRIRSRRRCSRPSRATGCRSERLDRADRGAPVRSLRRSDGDARRARSLCRAARPSNLIALAAQHSRCRPRAGRRARSRITPASPMRSPGCSGVSGPCRARPALRAARDPGAAWDASRRRPLRAGRRRRSCARRSPSCGSMPAAHLDAGAKRCSQRRRRRCCRRCCRSRSVRPTLARMERRDYDPFVPVEIAQWRRQWLIWRAARRPGADASDELAVLRRDC